MPQESPSPRKTTLPTGIVHADLFIEHDTGFDHPESPERYKVVMNALRTADFADRLCWLEPRTAEKADLLRCHTNAYVEVAKRDIEVGMKNLSTGDTSISKGTWNAAIHAVGGACVAVDAVINTDLRNAFCVLRPPGHHAAPMRGMGFCVFNNIALAAKYAQDKYDIGKVLVVDWDVHHGNGTQDAFYDDDSVFFFSTHQFPWYPGTGGRDETGQGKGLGTTMNQPFAAGAGRKEIFGVFETELCSIAQKFKPDLVLISAGFDSRQGDPLGEFQLTDEDFADLTHLTMDLAGQFAEGRVISMLEGGYDLDGLACAVTAHCRALANHQ